MNTLPEFFKGSDTKLGVFYPTHYLIAVFGNRAAADHAVQKLRKAGFAQDEAISAGGQDIQDLATAESGWGSLFMQALSRFFSTEQKFTDHDLAHARHDSGFVMVHCPTEDSKKAAWSVLEPENPLDARYYTSAGIEHLAGDFDTD